MSRTVSIEVYRESNGIEVLLEDWIFPKPTIFQRITRGTSTEWRIRPTGLRYLPRAYWRRRLTDTVRIEGLIPISHVYSNKVPLEGGNTCLIKGLRDMTVYLKAFPDETIRENRWLRVLGLEDYDIPYTETVVKEASAGEGTEYEKGRWAIERPLTIESRAGDPIVQDGRWNVAEGAYVWEYKWKDPSKVGYLYKDTSPGSSYNPVMTTLSKFTLELRRI